VLGNHDYTGDALAQQSPAIREVDSRWISVNKSFIVEAGNASQLNPARLVGHLL
jgi:tartrate-resistant acid phosphatase type 5